MVESSTYCGIMSGADRRKGVHQRLARLGQHVRAVLAHLLALDGLQAGQVVPPLLADTGLDGVVQQGVVDLVGIDDPLSDLLQPGPTKDRLGVDGLLKGLTDTPLTVGDVGRAPGRVDLAGVPQGAQLAGLLNRAGHQVAHATGGLVVGVQRTPPDVARHVLRALQRIVVHVLARAVLVLLLVLLLQVRRAPAAQPRPANGLRAKVVGLLGLGLGLGSGTPPPAQPSPSIACLPKSYGLAGAALAWGLAAALACGWGSTRRPRCRCPRWPA